MPISLSRVGNVIKKTALNEYNIIKDSKRAAQIAKGKYPDKVMAGTSIMVRKLMRDVGPEPAAGLLIGTFSNPVPGLSVVGYLFGRGFAEGRKALTKIIKNMHK